MYLVVAALIVVCLLLALLLIKELRKPKAQPVDPPQPPAPTPVLVPQTGLGISLLVPIRSDSGMRQEVWNWLREYWTHELPGAQICMGTDWQTPFCKTAAVNQAADQAGGDIIVILDADCYISGSVILDCATKIREARTAKRKLWYIPYRNFYRLTQEASQQVTSSDPKNPYRVTSPPPDSFIIKTQSNSPTTGHWWGALIQIMPREAFTVAGGMDERFAGWGGEDVSFMMAVDTLYAKHKTSANDVLHLWHPSTTSEENPYLRVWDGQDSAHVNDSLEGRYRAASGDRLRMTNLTEACRWGKTEDPAEGIEDNDVHTQAVRAVRDDDQEPHTVSIDPVPVNSGLSILWPAK